MPALLIAAVLRLLAGQGHGTLEGQILDASSQSPVEGATVTVANGAGEESVQTSATGSFVFGAIPSGYYRVTVTDERFQAFTHERVRVRMEWTTRVKYAIVPGSFTGPAVEIAAQSPAVTQGVGGPEQNFIIDGITLSTESGGTKPTEVSKSSEPTIPYALSARNFEAVASSIPGVHSDSTGVSLAAPRMPPPRSVGLQAGSHDDNLQYNAFVRFLAEHSGLGLQHEVSERIIIEVRDSAGLPVPDVEVAVGSLRRRTYSDGRALLFPGGLPQDARVTVAGQSQPLRDPASHVRTFVLPGPRPTLQQVPLDVAFILDTTASMGSEIGRLKQTLDLIHAQVTHLEPEPDVRFGLVEYRDRGDDFVTRVIPFTRDVEAFRRALQAVQAGGGGDEPEDVQAGLERALHGLDWRDQGVKLGFLIGDAAPHLDYGETFTYLDAAREAAARGIKLGAIGCSGLPLAGEVIWRELAQYTMAPYVFLSHGERGNSEGGPSGVSHHVGSNWMAENLETIVIRMIKSELGNLSPRPPQEQRDWFEARTGQPRDTVLADLFRQSARQLVDYSLETLEDQAPTVLLPLSVKSRKLQPMATDLEARLSLGLSGPFKLLERAGMPDLIKAVETQLGDNFDTARLGQVGKFVPARLAVLGQLAEDAAGKAELLVKLVRLETGELLSLSLLKIDEDLLAAR